MPHPAPNAAHACEQLPIAPHIAQSPGSDAAAPADSCRTSNSPGRPPCRPLCRPDGGSGGAPRPFAAAQAGSAAAQRAGVGAALHRRPALRPGAHRGCAGRGCRDEECARVEQMAAWLFLRHLLEAGRLFAAASRVHTRTPAHNTSLRRRCAAGLYSRWRTPGVVHQPAGGSGRRRRGLRPAALAV